MKRQLIWIAATIALIAAVLGAFALLTANGAADRAAERRKPAYQNSLRMFQQSLPAATTQAEVEDRLNSAKIHFETICPYEGRYTCADLVVIGEERPPWYCSSWPFQIAVEFKAMELGKNLLTKVELVHNLEGCF